MNVDDIYKVVSETLWTEAVKRGEFLGSAVDREDGYIHLSTAEQVVETVRKHFAGQEFLLLVKIDPDALGRALRWEPSRGGDLFPHLYGPLPLSAVVSAVPLPLSEDGKHQFPEELGGPA